ncbi:MAG: proline racemase family protein, partial [Pseudomonadota bacterium]
ETPVGVVDVEVLSPQQVSFENVESYVFQQDVRVEVPGIGEVVGDVAWGGNWFYLVRNSPIAVRVERIPDLTEVSLKIRAAIEAAGISGERGEEIDHIELFGPATVSGALAKNFVLCPGGAYDRSPCGTGTCAKMASLAARGRLRADEVWIQEGILGSVFSGQYRNGSDNRILPRLTGTAFVTGEALLEFSDEDPFRNGIVQ